MAITAPTPAASCSPTAIACSTSRAPTPRDIVDARRRLMGYVSQFLRVIPRVARSTSSPRLRATQDRRAMPRSRAREAARPPEPSRTPVGLPPATFSGGEQQRVNIARGFAGDHALLILDEPTASLDAVNRDAVADLIAERRAQGAGFLAIFHDDDVRASSRPGDRRHAFSAREAA